MKTTSPLFKGDFAMQELIIEFNDAECKAFAFLGNKKLEYVSTLTGTTHRNVYVADIYRGPGFVSKNTTDEILESEYIRSQGWIILNEDLNIIETNIDGHRALHVISTETKKIMCSKFNK